MLMIQRNCAAYGSLAKYFSKDEYIKVGRTLLKMSHCNHLLFRSVCSKSSALRDITEGTGASPSVVASGQTGHQAGLLLWWFWECQESGLPQHVLPGLHLRARSQEVKGHRVVTPQHR